MSGKDASSETVNEYKGRILRYQAGDDALVLQAKAPDVLAALVEGLSAEHLGQRPAPGKWCIREIVAHLADDELVGAYRIRLILSAPGTAIQAFDQDVWARTGRYSTRDIIDSLALYRTLRFANLKLLQSLSAQEWDIFGVHAERGIESIARYRHVLCWTRYQSLSANRVDTAPTGQGDIRERCRRTSGWSGRLTTCNNGNTGLRLCMPKVGSRKSSAASRTQGAQLTSNPLGGQGALCV